MLSVSPSLTSKGELKFIDLETDMKTCNVEGTLVDTVLTHLHSKLYCVS